MPRHPSVSTLTEQWILSRARDMRERKRTNAEISLCLGVSENWLLRKFNPDYAIREETRVVHRYHRLRRETREREKLSKIGDPRPFTARFFGDPMPGRSALDQIAKQGRAA